MNFNVCVVSNTNKMPFMDILLYGNNIKLNECSEPRTFINKNINDKFIKIDNFVPTSYF